MKVFLDANVIFAASRPGSHTERLIELLFSKGEAVTSLYAFEEARRNINRKFPSLAGDFEALTRKIARVPNIEFTLPLDIAAKDRPILCAAIDSRCHYLATGDKKDFGPFFDHTVQGVKIISLIKLFEILMAS